MRIALLILSIAGIAAVLRHLLTASSRLLRRGLDVFVASRVADVRAHHGDLTGLSNAQGARALARRERRGAITMVALWIALLAIPPLTSWPTLLYASYTLLWFVPRRRAPAR
jgi:hypothetical protein